MRDGTSTVEGAKSVGPSPLRLRVGVSDPPVVGAVLGAGADHRAFPQWAEQPSSVAAVTTTIVAVQTTLGLLGFWVAGTEVKSIIKGSTIRHALRAIWSMLLHGDIRGHGIDPNEGRPPRDDG
jgi:hypothetical protein